MRKIKKYHIIFYLIIGFTMTNCKEEIDIESLAPFESAMVIEARITNEYKFHEINISEAARFEEESPPPVSNANVSIVDDELNILNFYEDSSGQYISEVAFKAQPNKNYRLLISTTDGKSYESLTTKLTSITQIDQLNAYREINSYGTDGMAISVNSFDPSGNSRYYRYEYEESYKIIAPNWTYIDMIAESDFPFTISKVPKTEEKRVCYKTDISINIMQKETTALTEDNINNYIVRFISRDNPIISHRYSILIKQYVQSLEAYTYYKTLNKFSGSDNLFSQNQPGFFGGNINSTNDINEKVIGFFEVSSVSSKRIFFNYDDFFQDEELPPYFIDCETADPSNISDIPQEPSPLINTIHGDNFIFYINNPEYPGDDPDLPVGPYLFVPKACGDCTALGSNIVPDFWEE